jgi:hypothetical protein
LVGINLSTPWGRYEEAYKAIHNAIVSGITKPPEGRKITKIGFWEDANGNIKYIKYYDGATLLFTLEFSNAGAASSETWSIART